MPTQMETCAGRILLDDGIVDETMTRAVDLRASGADLAVKLVRSMNATREPRKQPRLLRGHHVAYRSRLPRLLGNPGRFRRPGVIAPFASLVTKAQVGVISSICRVMIGQLGWAPCQIG